MAPPGPTEPKLFPELPAARRQFNAPQSALLNMAFSEPNDSEPSVQDDAVAEAKAPHALKTISEAATMLGIPQHVLRFWESKFNALKPTKSKGGRRYYRPQDLETLILIKRLLYVEGYTIKGAIKAISAQKSGAAALVAPQLPLKPKEEKPAPKTAPSLKQKLTPIFAEMQAIKAELKMLGY